MTLEELGKRLAEGGIVPLAVEDWDALAPSFESLERHDTGMAGTLAILRGPMGLVAVEEPARGQRAVRSLADHAAARAFVEERLATYDRMWNGCGCKIDYFE